jgi:organic radical activating enzyme
MNDPKDFKINFIDPISDSWCAAKWFEGTIWLYKGMTASCHHNPFHQIELDQDDPSSLHNTPQKITERNSMLKGEKPQGCNYCWSIENSGGISDRVEKTKATPTERIINWYNNGKPLVETPYMLEIAFERTCNLACAYCSSDFSSKWVNDLKAFGSYTDIKTDSRYFKISEVIESENNQYIEAFFKWLPELTKKLTTIRITGGEPLLSSSFWKFLDTVTLLGYKGKISVNTNLINKKGEISKLIEKSKNLDMIVYTSIESNMDDAEYTRDGFDRNLWTSNLNRLLEETNIPIIISTSINNISVWSFNDLVEMIIEYKKEYGIDRITIGCNFVHYPIFMRVKLIDVESRLKLVQQLKRLILNNINFFTDSEILQFNRFYAIMTGSDSGIEESYVNLDDAYKDLKSFIAQYDKRRNKNYNTLSSAFVKWYNSIY